MEAGGGAPTHLTTLLYLRTYLLTCSRASMASGWCAGATTVHARWKGRLAQWKDVRLKKMEEKLAWPSAVSCCWHSPTRPCLGLGLEARGEGEGEG